MPKQNESVTTNDPVQNTDKELWREKDDYYAPSIHVTERGGIGINVGGCVAVKPLNEWHKLAFPYGTPNLSNNFNPQPTFEQLIRPVIKWLADNRNPHCKIIIENNSAELVSGEIGFTTEDYIHD